MMGNRVGSMFILKSIQNTYPYLSLIFLFITSGLFFAFALKIVESPVYYMDNELVENNVDYRYLENCIWNIMVSMTSVGYGDYYPSTNFGRMVIMSASLVGNALIALFVFSLERTFKLTTHEASAFSFSERLKYKMKMEEESAKLFFETFRFVYAKNKCIDKKNKGSVEFVLDKAIMVKRLLDRIKSKKAFRSSYQFFRNNFDRYSVTDLIKLKMDDLVSCLKEIKGKTEDMEDKITKMKATNVQRDRELQVTKRKLAECQKTIKHLMSNRHEESHSKHSSLKFNETIIDNYEALEPSEYNSELRGIIEEKW